MTITASLLSAIAERRRFSWICSEEDRINLLQMANIVCQYWKTRRTA